jgi:predicted N-acetyltransferase YhbS
MPDMLVNLLKLPPLGPALTEMRRRHIVIRRAEPFEITKVRSFVEQNFSPGWADEILVGFARQPVSVFVAIGKQELVGFAAYECTRRDFFGPTGVSQKMQGRGIGRALLLSSLWGLRELGYVYGIIGGAGPVKFYEKAVGAILIPDSDPGIYVDLLR